MFSKVFLVWVAMSPGLMARPLTIGRDLAADKN